MGRKKKLKYGPTCTRKTNKGNVNDLENMFT